MHTPANLSARRDHVIEQLSAGYAGNLFEVEELERRVALAHAADTPADLDALVTDLATPATTALVATQRMRAMFGHIERVGPWVVPAELAARVVCGNIVLDLREATLSPSTTITVHVTMGHFEVIVPPGVTVDVEASSFLANVEERTDPGPTGGPQLRIVGRVKLGNLEVSTRRRGESRREAQRRRRAERRARRAWRHGRWW